MIKLDSLNSMTFSEAANRLFDMWKKHGKSNFRLTVGSEEWVLLSEPDDVGVSQLMCLYKLNAY